MSQFKVLAFVSISLIAIPVSAGEEFAPAIPQTQPPPRAVKILFIGSSFMAGSGAMNCMVPVMLERKGWKVEVYTAMTSGGNVVKQWYWNRGELRPGDIKTLEAFKEKFGADSEKYKRKLAALKGYVSNYKGKLDAALAKGPFDYVVLIGSRQGPHPNPVVQNCIDQVTAMIRKGSPKAQVLLYGCWVSEGSPELQAATTFDAARAAKRNKLTFIPGGDVMHLAKLGRPELDIWRPKNFHQGLLGMYAISCLTYATITGQSPVGFPEAFVMPTSYGFHPEKKTAEFKMPKDVATHLQQTAWSVYQGKRCRVQSEPAGKEAAAADLRILVIADNYANYAGATYRTLKTLWPGKKVYVKVLTENAATFASHYQNNLGELTPRQQMILKLIENKTEDVGLIVPEGEKFGLDDMADFTHQAATEHFLRNKGKLDSLIKAAKWDYVLLQSYRETDSETEFQKHGKLLIEKIRKDSPKADIALLMSWPFQDKPGDLAAISAAYRKLAKDTGVKLAPLGDVWKNLGAAHKDAKLYYDRYSPTGLGQGVNACAIYTTLTGKKVNVSGAKLPGLKPKSRKADAAIVDTVWKLTQPAERPSIEGAGQKRKRKKQGANPCRESPC